MKNVDFLARLVNRRIAFTADLKLEFTYNATYDQVCHIVDHIERISWENLVQDMRREAYYVLDPYYVAVNLQPVISLSISKAIISSDILKCKISLKDVTDHSSVSQNVRHSPNSLVTFSYGLKDGAVLRLTKDQVSLVSEKENGWVKKRVAI